MSNRFIASDCSLDDCSEWYFEAYTDDGGCTFELVHGCFDQKDHRRITRRDAIHLYMWLGEQIKATTEG